MCLKYFSKVRPSFSKSVIKKMGRVETIKKRIAMSFAIYFFIKRYMGMPKSPAIVKPINCLLVRLKATFVLIFFKSFGIGT